MANWNNCHKSILIAHNFVCFDGDDCTNSNYLYRIISVDSKTNQVKLIKNSYYDAYTYWNNNNDYIAKAGDFGLEAGVSYSNIWAMPKEDGTYYTSTANANLNSNYLTSLGKNASLIDDTTWSIGGVSEALAKSPNNVKDFMEVELNNSVTYKSKIGLMYGSEYGYASLPTAWNSNIYSNSFSSYGTWLGFDNLTITRVMESKTNVYYTYWSSWYYVNTKHAANSNAFNPTFTLKSNVKILNAGSTNLGSQYTPMIIGG